MKYVKLLKIKKDSKLFTRAHKYDACFDIYAYIPEGEILIGPGQTVKVGTGIKMSIPEGFEGQIRPRSGMSLKTKLRVANAPGTVDTGFRNEVCVLLENIDTCESFIVQHEQRIAQIGFRRVPEIEVIEVVSDEELGKSERGARGFGSTGI